MSGHDPTVLASGFWCWVECSCGWRSGPQRDSIAASRAWAEHMADRVKRRAKGGHAS